MLMKFLYSTRKIDLLKNRYFQAPDNFDLLPHYVKSHIKRIKYAKTSINITDNKDFLPKSTKLVNLFMLNSISPAVGTFLTKISYIFNQE